MYQVTNHYRIINHLSNILMNKLFKYICIYIYFLIIQENSTKKMSSNIKLDVQRSPFQFEWSMDTCILLRPAIQKNQSQFLNHSLKVKRLINQWDLSWNMDLLNTYIRTVLWKFSDQIYLHHVEDLLYAFLL